MTPCLIAERTHLITFQYRKRYEVTCDSDEKLAKVFSDWFQYRKRYEVTCDKSERSSTDCEICRFNTASGMRSHVTLVAGVYQWATMKFQYRKRYEVTCDTKKFNMH